MRVEGFDIGGLGWFDNFNFQIFIFVMGGDVEVKGYYLLRDWNCRLI